MIRHLIPRFEWGRWDGAALTFDPNGGVELPNGLARSMRLAFGQPTTTPHRDQVVGGILCVQWLGLAIEVAIGKVR
ncbi:hypothetical protein [Sphingomonas sp. CFBP 13720]|uniref:hypothetical protein n=1 Tax=Sphingomonas sp. CFBP 13720 TaxID=2775302 RepID=UPI0017800102|nr:hypothetical protein [Sphingomonas sp. CFBP 13720]MBD8677954.1 hypothetical protein [Sphingomonas sp. CFBP 13720]